VSKPKTRASTAPSQPEVASFPTIQTGEHFPEAIDLRPYTPVFGFGPMGVTRLEYVTAAALAACFARRGTPLPFIPSPEHIEAVTEQAGDMVAGLNQYGVRENGSLMGSPPTEYDLTADAVRLSIEVFGIQSVDQIKPAFASGHVVRIGDSFLVSYGADQFVTVGGPVEVIDPKDVQIWKVERA